MSTDHVEAIVAEYPRWDAPDADPVLGALRVALFLEDALGIVIPEDLVDREHLGTPDAALRTIAEIGRRA